MKQENVPPRPAARRAKSRGAASSSDAPSFEPVPLRPRHDGWTPERQVAFIEALAETACVVQAAAAVGLSATAAYALRRRPEAQAFRLAWDAALDFGVRRLADAALSRAVHGVARPIFFQGEQVGERRYFDERLTQFLLRLRDPVRFGKWREGREADQHVDGPALLLSQLVDLASDAAFEGAEAGALAALPDPRRFVAALGLDPERYGIAPRDEDDDDDYGYDGYAGPQDAAAGEASAYDAYGGGGAIACGTDECSDMDASRAALADWISGAFDPDAPAVSATAAAAAPHCRPILRGYRGTEGE